MSRLHALLPSPVAQPRDSVLSPVSTGPGSLRHMVWLQQDLEVMHAEAKQRFRQTRPSSCVYCCTWIKCNMYNCGGAQCLGA